MIALLATTRIQDAVSADPALFHRADLRATIARARLTPRRENSAVVALLPGILNAVTAAMRFAVGSTGIWTYIAIARATSSAVGLALIRTDLGATLQPV
jgi:hypothetical protein